MAIKDVSVQRLSQEDVVQVLKDGYEHGPGQFGVTKESAANNGTLAVDLDGDGCPEAVNTSISDGVIKVRVDKVMECDCSFFRGMTVKTGPKYTHSYQAELALGKESPIVPVFGFLFPDTPKLWLFTDDGFVQVKINVEPESAPEWYCDAPTDKEFKKILEETLPKSDNSTKEN